MCLKNMGNSVLISYHDDCRNFLDNTEESQSAYTKATNELFRRLEAGEEAIKTIDKIIETLHSQDGATFSEQRALQIKNIQNIINIYKIGNLQVKYEKESC